MVCRKPQTPPLHCITCSVVACASTVQHSPHTHTLLKSSSLQILPAPLVSKDGCYSQLTWSESLPCSTDILIQGISAKAIQQSHTMSSGPKLKRQGSVRDTPATAEDNSATPTQWAQVNRAPEYAEHSTLACM